MAFLFVVTKGLIIIAIISRARLGIIGSSTVAPSAYNKNVPKVIISNFR